MIRPPSDDGLCSAILRELRRIPPAIRLLLSLALSLLLASCAWTIHQAAAHHREHAHAWEEMPRIVLTRQTEGASTCSTSTGMAAPATSEAAPPSRFGALQRLVHPANRDQVPPLTEASVQPFCSHLSSSALHAFLTAANAARAAHPPLQQHDSHAIPTQIVWNYGMWERTPDPSEEDSASPIPLTLRSSILGHLPPAISARLRCWLALYPPPVWQHLLFTRRASEALLLDHPSLAAAYRSLTRPVQRSDLIRYASLRAYGGLYLDLDVRPKEEPLEALWADHPQARMLLFEETMLTPREAAAAAAAYPIRQGRGEECQRIANYMLASAPHHPMLDRLLEELQARAKLTLASDYDVLYTTGPALLTTVTYQFLGAPSTAPASASAAAAASSDCSLASSLPSRDGVVIVRRPTDQRFFDHMGTGAWRNSQDTRERGD